MLSPVLEKFIIGADDIIIRTYNYLFIFISILLSNIYTHTHTHTRYISHTLKCFFQMVKNIAIIIHKLWMKL
jgi:hypothetical protein